MGGALALNFGQWGQASYPPHLTPSPEYVTAASHIPVALCSNPVSSVWIANQAQKKGLWSLEADVTSHTLLRLRNGFCHNGSLQESSSNIRIPFGSEPHDQKHQRSPQPTQDISYTFLTLIEFLQCVTKHKCGKVKFYYKAHNLNLVQTTAVHLHTPWNNSRPATNCLGL